MIENDFFCNFVKITENNYECSKCGNKIVIEDGIDEAPIFPCFSPLQNYSSANVINFMSEHTDSKELCDNDTLEFRHNICASCEFLKGNSCDKCGCNLTRDRNYLNKLALKNESCPLKKW